MAKLLKASTARKRAQETDLAALALADIAEGIAAQSARGEFGLSSMVHTSVEEEVVTTLEKAGYKVTYPHYEFALSIFGARREEAAKNWLQRLLARFFGDTSEEALAPVYSESRAQREWEDINISWAPISDSPDEEG
jgi:hypothetical protein